MRLGDVQPPAGEVRQRAHDILKRAEFTRHESIVQRVLNWIGDQLSRFSFGVGGGPGILGDLISLAVIAAVITLIVVLVRAYLRRSRPEKSEPVEDLTIELEEGRSATDWRSDAERFEAAGEWREAMRARYRELVRGLIDERVLDDLPGRTTGEYRDDFVATRPAAADAFRALTELFERVWYGGVEARSDDVQRFRQLAEQARRREVVGV